MAEDTENTGTDTAGKRRKFIRESIAKSKQFAGEVREMHKTSRVQLLLHKIGLADRVTEENQSASGETTTTTEAKPGAIILDPVKFKRTLSRIIKLLILWELVGALIDGTSHGEWGRFINDAFIAGALLLMWERITSLVRRKRVEYRRRMELARTELKMKDALIFSLLWSDEIFTNIPPDRRRIATISYSLIAIGIVVAILHIGGSGLMPLALAGALVLAAVNLLVWVVSLERGEKESLQTELRLAHEVQDSLMPLRPPVIEGLDVAGMSLAAQNVGGDLFDYTFPMANPRKLAVAVADVSGKGMKAAMSSVFTTGAYAAEIRSSDSPAVVLTRLNRAVYAHTRRGNFVAFLLMVFDPSAMKAVFANGGLTKPLLKSGDDVRWLDHTGVNFGIGMRDNSTYQETTVKFQHGDVVIMLTDGFTEAMNILQEPFGTERMEAFLRSFNTERLTAAQILEIIMNEVRTFTGTAPQHDDMSMVVIKIK